MNLRIGLHFPRSELLSVLEIRLDFALATLNQIMTVDQVERKGKKNEALPSKSLLLLL